MSIGDAFRIDPIDGFKDYGDLSAVDPPYRVSMRCNACKTKWRGCWDNFQCPECGEGELPNNREAIMSACVLCLAPDLEEPGYGHEPVCSNCGQKYYGDGDGWATIALDNGQLNLLRIARGLPTVEEKAKDK